ncbi:MAG TPA: FGGY-family carbohydrate kinase [Nitrososphaerales archaeon]|nr:FGGY-family carbohydrate kinase [Nitrososphaerales archaeon]
MPNARILAIDLGTTRCKVGVVGPEGEILTTAARELHLVGRGDGSVEGTEQEWRSAVFSCIREVLKKTGAKRISMVTVTAQTACPVCFDRSNRPVGPIISHLDTRAEVQFREAIRTFPDSYVASKLMGNLSWIRDKSPNTFGRIAEVCDVGEYVGRLLTGRLTHDATWLPERRVRKMAELLGMEEGVFGTEHDNFTPIGEVTEAAFESCGLQPGTPILISPFDGMSCIVGSGLVRPNVLAEVAGTTEVLAAVTRLGLSTTKHAIPGLRLFYTSPPLGFPYDWFRKMLYASGESEEQRASVEREVASIPAGPGSLLFVPSFSNVNFSWKISGELLNIEFGEGRNYVMKAVMEGITMRVKTIIDTLRDKGVTVQSVRISGGGSRSNVWNNIRADIYGTPVELLQTSETGCLGSAVFAAVSLGLYPSLREASRMMVHVTRTIRPNPSRVEAYGKMYRRFKAVSPPES